VLRHADPDRDGQACAAIYAPHVESGIESFEERAPSSPEMAGRIAAISATHPWLVAERDGVVTGYAYASPHRDRAGYRWAADVAVYVASAARGQGVGRELYTALLALLARQGIHVACAGISLPNAASVALHESMGFELVGIYRAIGVKLGEWRDVGWWQARLLPPDAPPAEPRGPQRLA
jgi:phosphinothricin acetyltransferase